MDRRLAGYSPQGYKKLDMTEHTRTTYIYIFKLNIFFIWLPQVQVHHVGSFFVGHELSGCSLGLVAPLGS